MIRSAVRRLFVALLWISVAAAAARAQVLASAPALLAPSGSLAGASPEFSWSPAVAAEGEPADIRYDLFLYNAQSGQVITKGDLSGTSYTLSPETVDIGVPYRWWLRARDLLSGEIGEWSGPLSFSVHPGQAPSPVAPLGTVDVNAGAAVFTWTYAGLIPSAVFDLYVFNPADGSVSLSQGVANGHAIALPVGCYSWWVRARGFETSSASDWSVQSDFCLALPAPPVPVAPDQGIGDTTGGPYAPTFSWTYAEALPTTVYDLEIACPGSAVAITRTGLTGTSYVLEGETLPADPACSWTIAARDSATGAVTETASRAFNTLDVPHEIAVLSLATSAVERQASPLFRFGHPSFLHAADTAYDVWIFNPALNLNIVREDLAGNLVDASTREYQLDTVLPGGYDYTYYLRSRNDTQGTLGAWGVAQSFRIPLFGDLVPTAIEPQGTVESSPTFGWSFAGGDENTRFDLYLYNETDDELTASLTTPEAGTLFGAAALGVSLESGKTYFLWIRARDLVQGGVGPWSATAVLTVQ